MFTKRISASTHPFDDVPCGPQEWFIIELLDAVLGAGLMILAVGGAEEWADAKNERE
jgi:hypothetical protein